MKRFNKIFFVILTMIAGVTMLVFNNAKQHKVVVNELKNDMKFALHTVTVIVRNKSNLNQYTSGSITVNGELVTCKSVYEQALSTYGTFSNINYGQLTMVDLVSNPYSSGSWCPAGGETAAADLSQAVYINGYAVKKVQFKATVNNTEKGYSNYNFKVLDGENKLVDGFREVIPSVTGYSPKSPYKFYLNGTEIEYLSSAKNVTGTVIITVPYEPKTSAYVFLAEGGTFSDGTDRIQQSVSYGSTYYQTYNSDFPQPTKTGYTFAGWYDAETGGNKHTSNEVVNGSLPTLYAHWVAEQYTITYNSAGGEFTSFPSQTVVRYTAEYGSKYQSYSVERAGYNFLGWFSTAFSGTKITTETIVTTTSPRTLYAHWSPKEYTVSFNATDGTVSPTSKTVIFDSVYGELPTPTKSGYDFVGWYDAATGGTQVTASTVVTETRNHTLYAHWQTAGITVTLNLNASDASFPSGSSSTKTVYYGETYGTMPTPRRAGYVFKGWYDAATGGRLCQNSARVTNASNHTLYAHWEAMEITVSFNGNNGTPSSTSKTVTYGQPYGDLPTATRTGYNFLGWYDAASGGTKYESSTTVSTTSTTQTLYAHWEAMTITVTFNPNEGSLSSSSSSTKQVTYTQPYGTLATATRYGYDFLGWYDQQTGGTKYTSSTVVTTTNTSQTLYAHWQVKNVVIKFNANNGSVSPTQKTVTFGAAYGDLPTPTREGYDFAGWYTAASGGNKVTSSNTVDTISEITIFAHWNQEQILDGGIIKINNSGVLISVSQYKGSHSDVTKVMNSGGQEKASTANIVTGDHLLKGNKEYRVVVIGDVDGNGKTNTTDFARIWKHMDRADSFTFTDELQLLAADVDESGEVKTSDYSKLWKMIKRG